MADEVVDDEASQRRPSGLRSHLNAMSSRALAALSALVTAGASWVVVAALISLGWLGQGNISYAQVLGFTTQAWLLGHGVPMHIDELPVSVAPLGFVLLVMIVAASLTASMARRIAHREFGGRARTERQDVAAGSFALRISGWFTATYTVILIVLTLSSGGADHVGRALVSGILICGPVTLVAAGRQLGWSVIGFDQPGWLRGVVAGVWTAVTVLLAVAGLVLMVALIAHHDEITALHEGLKPGGLGGVLLTIAQLGWLPNAVLWTASWLLGAGFTVGAANVVTPTSVMVGALPDLPLLGALPQTGGVTNAGIVWLLLGACVGAVGAVVAVRARRNHGAQALPPRSESVDMSCLVGLGVGLISGLVICVLALFSQGALGSQQLASVGPQMARLVVLAPTVMGAGGLLGGYFGMKFFNGELSFRRGQNAEAVDDTSTEASPDDDRLPA